MLLNLCINARDAMPLGGQLTFATENIALDDRFCASHPWAKPGNYVRVTVSDTGEGIEPEVLEHIFEPFFTTKGPQKGSGLGLSMVYGLMEQHKGLIDVESTIGLGSAFRIYFPVDSAGDTAQEHEHPGSRRKTNPTILIAEDERDLLNLTRRMLEIRGYKVFSAIDGEQALELFEEHAQAIDIVLLDLVMPKKSGTDVYENIKATRPDIHVIFQTGYDSASPEGSIVATEGCKVLQKPYSESELLEALRVPQ